MLFRNKKILLVGLGRLGGGTSTARFLSKNGALLTVTDKNIRENLKDSLKKLKSLPIKFVLGEHRESDFKKNDIVIFNPAIGIFSPWVKFARKYKRRIENDLTLFLKILETKNPQFEYIAVTGTRGKTTTTNWVGHFLSPAFIGGNIPTRAPFKILEKIVASRFKRPIVLELSSFQLEYMDKSMKSPKVAVITNLYNDHLNRYGTLDVYARQKAKIFLNQKKSDFLILNYDDPGKKYFLREKIKSHTYYISSSKIPRNRDGLFFLGDTIYFQEGGETQKITRVSHVIGHEKYNLLAALLASRLHGVSWGVLVKRIRSLPAIPFREEVVLKKQGITVINDSAATSPDATIAAIERFKRAKELYLICGGTDKNLDFRKLAKVIWHEIPPKHLLLLNGSATKKLIYNLEQLNYFKNEPLLFETLRQIMEHLRNQGKQSLTILFSPAAASFEKFKNEFDRGRKFNTLMRRYYSQQHYHEIK